MTETIPERVARGAALLDEKLPGWHERIDLDRLDLGCGCCCVLGQELDQRGWTAGGELGYDFGLREWFNEDWIEAARHGFAAEGMPGGDEFDALDAEWKRVTEERRGGEGDA